MFVLVAQTPTIPTAPVISITTIASTVALQINLVTPGSEATYGVSGYDIERSLDGINFMLPTNVAHSNIPASAFPYIDTSLLPGTTYYYRLRSVSANPNDGYRSAASNVVNAATNSQSTSFRKYNPGFYTALNPPWRSFNDSGTILNPWPGAGTINYANGSVPGGHTGTQNYTGGSPPAHGTVGKTVSGSQIVYPFPTGCVGTMLRYYWSDIEPTTKGSYIWTQMDADLAQCIALGVKWIPLIISKTFSNSDPEPMPAYLSAISYVDSSGGKTGGRWDAVNYTPNIKNLFKAIGNRYDGVAAFQGIGTGETAVGNINLGAANYDANNYLTALKAETDSISINCPTSRHFMIQNFVTGSVLVGGVLTDLGINFADWILDQLCAYAQKNGAVVMGPDLVTGGSVVTRCYPRYRTYSQGGTVTRASNSKWGGGSTKFTGTGPTGCSLQRAEYIGIGPSQNDPIQTAFNFGVNTANDPLISFCVCDWHYEVGSPNPQIFIPSTVSGTNYPGTTDLMASAANRAAFIVWTPTN